MIGDSDNEEESPEEDEESEEEEEEEDELIRYAVSDDNVRLLYYFSLMACFQCNPTVFRMTVHVDKWL